MLVEVVEGYPDVKFEVGLLCRVLRNGDVYLCRCRVGRRVRGSASTPDLRPTFHHNKHLNISATTGYFHTKIKPKNHLSKLYRTHRLSSNSMRPFSRSLLPTISRQRLKISPYPKDLLEARSKALQN